MNPYRQCVTYWAPGASDGFGGTNYGTPVAFKGRWEDRQEQFMDTHNQLSLSKAIIYLPKGNVTPEIGGYLFLGESTAADPTQVKGAHEIRQFMQTPDLRHIRTEYRAII